MRGFFDLGLLSAVAFATGIAFKASIAFGFRLASRSTVSFGSVVMTAIAFAAVPFGLVTVVMTAIAFGSMSVTTVALRSVAAAAVAFRPVTFATVALRSVAVTLEGASIAFRPMTLEGASVAFRPMAMLMPRSMSAVAFASKAFRPVAATRLAHWATKSHWTRTCGNRIRNVHVHILHGPCYRWNLGKGRQGRHRPAGTCLRRAAEERICRLGREGSWRLEHEDSFH